jgi:hypothetical protein
VNERRETGCAGWIGALSLGLIAGVLTTGVGGPFVGIVVTVLVIWGSTRVFASPVAVPTRDTEVALNVAGETVRSLRGVLQCQGGAADTAPSGDEMIALALDVRVENFDALGGALGLADGSPSVLYRDAVTQPGVDGVDVCALATLAALVPKRGGVSAAPIGTLLDEDLARWPQFLMEPFAVQVAMQQTDSRRAWMLFRRSALFMVDA